MRRSFPLAALVAAVAGLAACGTDTKDFKEQGEKFVEGDDVRERFGMVRMSDAECEEPASTDTDVTFTCVATGSDDNTWQFTIEITGDTSMRMTSGAVIAPAAVSPTVAPTTIATTATPAPPTTAAPAPATAGG